MIVNVNVTQNHIDKGERHSSGRCPIALALSDVKRFGFRRFQGASVGSREAAVTMKRSKECLFGPLPLIARHFVEDFDRYGAKGVRPISFTMELN
jgi:hypothetical protein